MCDFMSFLFGPVPKPSQPEYDNSHPTQTPVMSRPVYNLMMAKERLNGLNLNSFERAFKKAIRRSTQEYPLIYIIMSEKCELLKEWPEQVMWLKKAEAYLQPEDRFCGALAHSRLGWAYFLGRGCEPDNTLAYKHFCKGFECDPFRGAFDMAFAYMAGIGCEPELDMAVRYLRRSNLLMRHKYLAEIEYYHNGVESGTLGEDAWKSYITGHELFSFMNRPSEAIPYLKNSIERGFLPACVLLSDLYAAAKNYDKAIESVMPAHEAGYAPATHQYACHLYQKILGENGQQEVMELIASLFKCSAEQGYVPSYISIGECYRTGYGVAPNQEEARRWFAKAMKTGEEGAEFLYNMPDSISVI